MVAVEDADLSDVSSSDEDSEVSQEEEEEEEEKEDDTEQTRCVGKVTDLILELEREQKDNGEEQKLERVRTVLVKAFVQKTDKPLVHVRGTKGANAKHYIVSALLAVIAMTLPKSREKLSRKKHLRQELHRVYATLGGKTKVVCNLSSCMVVMKTKLPSVHKYVTSNAVLWGKGRSHNAVLLDTGLYCSESFEYKNQPGEDQLATLRAKIVGVARRPSLLSFLDGILLTHNVIGCLKALEKRRKQLSSGFFANTKNGQADWQDKRYTNELESFQTGEVFIEQLRKTTQATGQDWSAYYKVEELPGFKLSVAFGDNTTNRVVTGLVQSGDACVWLRDDGDDNTPGGWMRTTMTSHLQRWCLASPRGIYGNDTVHVSDFATTAKETTKGNVGELHIRELMKRHVPTARSMPPTLITGAPEDLRYAVQEQGEAKGEVTVQVKTIANNHGTNAQCQFPLTHRRNGEKATKLTPSTCCDVVAAVRHGDFHDDWEAPEKATHAAIIFTKEELVRLGKLGVVANMCFRPGAYAANTVFYDADQDFKVLGKNGARALTKAFC